MRDSKSVLRLGRRWRMVFLLVALLPGVLAFTGLTPSPAAAAPIVVVDDGGPDDEPGQKDLNQLTTDVDSPSADLVVTWNWDVISVSGRNTGDACSLYDTDGDGMANFALCVIWGTNAVYQTTRLYSCGDGAADRCDQTRTLLAEDRNGDGDLLDAGEALVGGPYESICSLSVVADTFGARDGAQASTTSDTQAACLIELDDFGVVDAFLLNVCSFPSQVPGSDPSDCVVNPGSGFLTIVKVADPNDGTPFRFDLGADQAANNGMTSFTINGSGTTGPVGFAAGTGYDLTEVVPASFELESAQCLLSNGTETGTLSADTITDFEIQTGRTTTCTFTNGPALEPPQIELVKTADPTSVDEPGGIVTFTVQVTNTGGPGTIDSLVDDIHGDLSSSCLDGGGVPLVEQLIDAGQTLTCTFSAAVTGNAGESETDTVTAGVSNGAGSDSASDTATVTIDDLPSEIEILKTATPDSVDEPGGSVTFDFVINNLSAADEVTIDTLDDSIHGDLNGRGDCSVPQTIAVGGSYSCSFTAFVAGNAGDSETNVVTAAGTDDDGQAVTDDDDATVTVDDVPSSIKVTKEASPVSVPETGGDATFTVKVENTSAVDDVTINSVSDTEFGDVSGSCAPALPVTLAPGETTTCTFTEFISGNAGESHINVATASGVDDDGLPVESSDREDVPFEDVKPDITVTKTADPTSVPETGGDVTFTFVVVNNATEAANLDTLVDSDFGDLNGRGSCVTPQSLTPGGEVGDSYTCSLTVSLSGDASGPAHSNTVTATASDDDGNSTTDTADETVPFTDVLPDVSITKTADPTSVPETGGDVEFTIVVTNNSLEDATIDSLVDSEFDLAVNCSDAVGTVLVSEGSYTCTFTETLTGDASGPAHENTATVVASDGDGNTDTESDDETVAYSDVLPTISVSKTADPISVPETGGDVTFSIVVTNNAAEDATLDSLIDTELGDLSGRGTCATPQPLAANGGTYSCELTVFLSGNAAGPDHYNVVTATASDNEKNPATASDDATVVFEDVLPDISITKTADPTSVDEPGATVQFTLVVTNNSLEEVTIDSLTDSDYNTDLTASCPEATAVELQYQQEYVCVFTAFVTGNAADGPHENTATVVGSDDEGNTDKASDIEEVIIDDVEPLMTVTKTPNQDEVFAPGEAVTFTVRVENDSVSTDPLTITSIVDDVFGDLSAECVLPLTIGAGAAFECDVTHTITADHTNTATVTAEDDEGDEILDSASASVGVINPSVSIEKSTNGFDADFAPGPEILVDEAVTWTYAVTNNGDVPLTDIAVKDDIFGDVCTISSLEVGATETCSIDGTAFEGPYLNVGDARTTFTDADGDSTDRLDRDFSHYFGADPSLVITKTFADDTMTAGGAGSSFELVVTNDGNVDLEDVSVFDDVDDRLTVTGVSGTAGVDDDSDGDAQTIEWLIADLAVGDSVTITVDFTVASSVEEADGPGGVNDDPVVGNTATATSDYVDDVGNSTTVDDEAADTIGVVTSADLRVEKVDAFDPILAGFQASYTVTVFNAGPSDAHNVVATDTLPPGVTLSSTNGCQEDPDGVPTCNLGTIPAGESAGYGLIVDVDPATAGTITNSATVTSDDPDPDDGNNTAEEDTFVAAPSIDITKTFGDDAVIAGGAGSSFDLVVANDGNVELSGVSITDVVDDRLAVTGVSSADGGVDCSASTGQTVDCTADLGVGESVTITVDFSVAADVAGADAVPNTATASTAYTDAAGNTADLSDEATDTVDLESDLTLSIVKTFDPSSVSPGGAGSFTLRVSNTGPSDAVDVSVLDVVDDLLGVVDVLETAGSVDCSDSSGQLVDCTAQLPAGGSATITVEYVVAPFLDGGSGNLGGDDFRFVFVNGSVLEGSTATGEVFLDGVDVSDDVTIITGLSRNDLVFDPPGPDPAFELHLSCSDTFTGGWGQSGGPVEGVDTSWQIAYFSIARFNNNGFIKGCSDVVNPLTVLNQATASGEDSGGTETATGSAVLTIGPGVMIDRVQANGRRLTLSVTNGTGDKIIEEISVEWPTSNGDLTRIRLDDPTVWQGNEAPPAVSLGAADAGWNGGTLLTGESLLRFDFANKSADSGYTIAIMFTDGTSLDTSL